MGFFDGFIEKALPAIGGFIAGPPGAAIGGAIAGGLASANAEEGAEDANTNNWNVLQSQQAFSASQAQRQMEFQADQVAQQRYWQQEMSNTSYQRATSDMKSAGLNPMLAYSQGGAGTPTGSAATGASGSGGSALPAQNTKMAAIQANQMYAQTAATAAQVDKTRADTNLVNAQTATELKRPELTEQQTGETRNRAALHDSAITKINAELSLISARVGLTREEEQRAKAMARAAILSGDLDIAKTNNEKINFVFKELDMQRAWNEHMAQRTPWKHQISPYLDDMNKITNSAGNIGLKLNPFTFGRHK